MAITYFIDQHCSLLNSFGCWKEILTQQPSFFLSSYTPAIKVPFYDVVKSGADMAWGQTDRHPDYLYRI
jgi:hypothetical protein